MLTPNPNSFYRALLEAAQEEGGFQLTPAQTYLVGRLFVELNTLLQNAEVVSTTVPLEPNLETLDNLLDAAKRERMLTIARVRAIR